MPRQSAAPGLLRWAPSRVGPSQGRADHAEPSKACRDAMRRAFDGQEASRGGSPGKARALRQDGGCALRDGHDSAGPVCGQGWPPLAEDPSGGRPEHR